METVKYVVGVRQTVRALKEDKVQKVIIAEDASEYVTGQINELLKQKGLKADYVSSMKKLGNSCGIDRPAAAAAIIKK